MADVEIYPNIQASIGEIVGATSASYSTPYSYVTGISNVPLGVNPFVSASLATATFTDQLSYAGTLTADGTGTAGIDLTVLDFGDTLTLTGLAGQVIPFTAIETVRPNFGSGNINAISQTLGVGGNVASGLTQTVCFGVNSGCGGVASAGGINAPYSIVVNGTVTSGGQVIINSLTTGYSQFVVYSTATPVGDTLSLDGSIQFIVPQGIGVTSDSGVFPITVSPVPLPAPYWLMLSGIGGLGAYARRRESQPRG